MPFLEAILHPGENASHSELFQAIVSLGFPKVLLQYFLQRMEFQVAESGEVGYP